MDHCVPAFAERNDYDTVQADQIIQQGVVIVGLVHDEIINQRERDGSNTHERQIFRKQRFRSTYTFWSAYLSS